MDKESMKNEQSVMEELFTKLKQAEHKENIFSMIVAARSVQELIDGNFSPEELIPIFSAAEHYAREEELILSVLDNIGEELKTMRSSKRRRAFFI